MVTLRDVARRGAARPVSRRADRDFEKSTGLRDATSMSTAARPFAGEIRQARPDDYPPMAELAGQLGYPSSAHEIARRLAGLNASGEHVVFVAQLADGTIAGWIGAFV